MGSNLKPYRESDLLVFRINFAKYSIDLVLIEELCEASGNRGTRDYGATGYLLLSLSGRRRSIFSAAD